MAAGNALFVVPQPFTVSSADQSSLQPATNLNQNSPGLLWAAASGQSAQITVAGGGQTVDTIALIGSNLVAADSIAIRYAATVSGLGSATQVLIPAYTGATLTAPYTCKTVYQLPTPIPFNYIQVVCTASAAKSFSAQRLVVGKAVNAAGIEYAAEQGWEDRSVSLSGPGWVGWQQFGVVPTWKVTCSFIKNADWRASWQPFFASVGNSAPFLFVPNALDPHPHDVIFGTFDGSPGKGSVPGYDAWTADMQMVALSP